MLVHLTRKSGNRKTGPIPVSTSPSSTCPKDCPQFNTCYGKDFRMRRHWAKVDNGEYSTMLSWKRFCHSIAALPGGQVWRHNGAGDLPGKSNTIDGEALEQLVEANEGRKGFTFSHKRRTPKNLGLIRMANRRGFAINLSCDSLLQAAIVKDGNPDLPVVAIVKSTEKRTSWKEYGHKVTVCPAQTEAKMQCKECQLCTVTTRKAIVAFKAHGLKKKQIDEGLGA